MPPLARCFPSEITASVPQVSMVKRLLSLFILYPLVYPPMALAGSFDRVFVNPFLRQRLPARYHGTPLQGLYACLSRPHASIHRATCYVSAVRARACASAHILEYEEP